MAGGFGGQGFDLGVLVVEGDLQHGLLFDSIAVHVYRFENSLGEIVFLRGGQFGHQKIEED